jgi:serine/threonine protein kinase
VGATENFDQFACSRCGAPLSRRAAVTDSYRCPDCNLQIAHLEFGSDGTASKFIAWLRPSGYLLRNRYRITAALGTGGFAATYLAEDLLLKGKRRAIKEIVKHRYDPHEADLLSRLQHPSIPDITDRFELDGFVYLVLQFAGTQTLESERLKRGGTIDPQTLVPWMNQLCETLMYLHSRTPPIVHRDLKPENVLLDERNNIALIDFGIAKESTGVGLTRAMARCVSHGFSPPEQELGTGTDQRSDVYALGATMYALVTGRIPPGGNERLAGTLLTRPTKLAPNLPVDLEVVLLKALELSANRRQQTIAELDRALRGLSLTSEPNSNRIARNRVKGRGTVLEATVPEAISAQAPGTTRHPAPGATVQIKYRPKARRRNAFSRIVRTAVVLLFLGGTAFGASYLYSDFGLQKRLGIETRCASA